jgi:hypothetical protein
MGHQTTIVEYTRIPSQNPGAYRIIFIGAKDALPASNAFPLAEHPSLLRCSLLSFEQRIRSNSNLRLPSRAVAGAPTGSVADFVVAVAAC